MRIYINGFTTELFQSTDILGDPRISTDADAYLGALFYHQNRVVSPSTVITHYPAHEPRMNHTRTAHEHADHIMCIVPVSHVSFVGFMINI